MAPYFIEFMVSVGSSVSAFRGEMRIVHDFALRNHEQWQYNEMNSSGGVHSHFIRMLCFRGFNEIFIFSLYNTED